MQGDEIPVTVHLSKGGGDPFAHFSSTVGMATRFYLPDGCVTNLVMLSQKLFIAFKLDKNEASISNFMDTYVKEPLKQVNRYDSVNNSTANINNMKV